MKGRKPIPTNLKKLKGTLQKSRVIPFEVKSIPLTRIPIPPETLGRFGLIEWNKVYNFLISGNIVSEVDMNLVSAYCHEADIYWTIIEHLSGPSLLQNLTDMTANGTSVQNHLIGIKNKSFKNMQDIAVQFGFTASARTRIGSVEPKEEVDLVSQFQKKIS